MTETAQPSDERPPMVVITGPTAGGKSGLALALAEAFDGVIINADSMQVYRELRILTARPGAEALARAPHRLYGVLPGREPCSAGRWREMALDEVAAARSEGRLPLVVGGTGLYLRALAEGLAPVPSVPEAVRDAARALYDKLGGAAFHAELAARDPVMAARLEPGDSQRLIRAWEVLEATGRSLADWQAPGGDRGGSGDRAGTGLAGAAPAAAAALAPAPARILRLVCLPPRPALYAACDARLRAMVENGALEEVRALRALDLDPRLPVMKALGVRELGRHLDGALSLDDAIAQTQQATRNYAKRQMTWLRTQTAPDGPRAVTLNEQYSKSLDPKIFPIIRRFLLTG
jgi:tRNA dimethylallyltransferase